MPTYLVKYEDGSDWKEKIVTSWQIDQVFNDLQYQHSIQPYSVISVQKIATPDQDFVRSITENFNTY